MSCIVGLVDKGKVYIGGDSAGIAGLQLTIRADEKVFRNGPMVMGFTSSFRMGQLLRYSLNIPKLYEEQDVFNFMVTDFMKVVRQCLKDGGFARKDNEVEQGGTFLVGFRGQLFTVYSDYQVAKTVVNYTAVGCGEHFALGSLYSTAKIKKGAHTRVGEALRAAEKFSAGVSGPFHIEVA